MAYLADASGGGHYLSHGSVSRLIVFADAKVDQLPLRMVGECLSKS